MPIESGDRVTMEYVARTAADDEVFDTSRRDVAIETGLADEQTKSYTPLTVTVGEGELIDGLDTGLIGLQEGDTETFTIPPEEAYGEWTDEQTVSYSPGSFKGMLEGTDPEVGMNVQIKGGRTGEIIEATEETVRIDFNHDLAGETLVFEVEILDVE
jgi:FKBP-type peptidyl-prolyl cis-trans isomerase 2